MKIKFISITLFVVIFIGIISQYDPIRTFYDSITLKNLQEYHDTSAEQIESATHYIGLSFDWYAVTLPSNVVKYLHDIKSANEAKDALKRGRRNNEVLLQKYYQTALSEENDEVEFIREQNALVNEMLVDIYDAIDEGDKETIAKMLPHLYNTCEEICNKINKVIFIKASYDAKVDEDFNIAINDTRSIMKIAFALLISIFLGLELRDKNTKLCQCGKNK